MPDPEPDPTFPGLNRDPLSEVLSADPDLTDVSPSRAEEIAGSHLTKIVGSWGGPARTYVLEARDYQERVERYNTATGMRDLLGAIADQNAFGTTARTYRLPYSISLLSAFSLVQGGVVLEPPAPLKPFLEEVELERIKRCAKCRKIFWAGRLNKPCCSPACRNAYKQKKHREREKENRLYKKRRAARRLERQLRKERSTK